MDSIKIWSERMEVAIKHERQGRKLSVWKTVGRQKPSDLGITCGIPTYTVAVGGGSHNTAFYAYFVFPSVPEWNEIRLLKMSFWYI